MPDCASTARAGGCRNVERGRRRTGPASPGQRHGSRRGRRARRIRVMLVVAIGVVIADQVTKSLAVSRLSSGPVHLIGPFALVLSYNTGVAFQHRGQASRCPSS